MKRDFFILIVLTVALHLPFIAEAFHLDDAQYLDVALNVAGTLSYGVDFDRETGSVGNQAHNRNNTGYYVQQQFEAWDRLNVAAGVRIEDSTTFGTTANPKLGLSLRLRQTRSTSGESDERVSKWMSNGSLLGFLTQRSNRRFGVHG